VKPLLADLVRFANRTDLPPAIQAAIVHAQFETIHPFSDGNGRVGRALIHVILRKRGLTPHYVPPVSLVLAADARSYVEGLTAYRAGKLEDWCGQFSRALNRAASKAVELDGRVRALQDSWRSRMGPLRSDASAEKLIQKLPAYPTITVSIAAELLGRSKQAANQAVIALAEARVLKATTLAKRNRAWEATELFDLINELERELAIPAGETRPVRAAPRPGPRRT
jgi:Fic family protein